MPLAEISAVDYAIVAVYLLGMLGLGALVSTRIKAFKDYFLAGGALTTPLLVCTLVSSYYGLDVTFGTSETSFYYGIVAWFWYSLPYYVFIALAALVIAPRLRRYGDAMTLSDILETHYGTPTRVVGALASFVYSAPIVAMAGMMTMMAFLGLPVGWGMAATIGVCAVYTVMGGLWADAISDTVQFVLMCVSLAIAIPLAVDWIGGWEFVNALPKDAGGKAMHLAHHGGLSYWMLVAWSLTGLTVLVEPAFYQRVFAAQNKQSVQRALLVGILLWASYDWGVTVIGLVARAAVQSGMLPENLQGREALLSVCVQTLPLGLRGLFLGGVLAAAMSTVDSYSLLASGNVVYDIYRPIFDPHASDKRLIRLTRVGVFAVMLIAALISLFFDRMRDTWQFMTSVMTSVVFVPVMGALFFRPRPAAGLWGSVAGLVGLVVFYLLVFTQGTRDPEHEKHVWIIAGVQVWQDYAALCALPVSLIGFVLGNQFGRQDPI
ncbi:MAG: sodium:solute symporter family protein [Pirellulales bacterium]